jgi:chromatin remodeling complex protein RSC6
MTKEKKAPAEKDRACNPSFMQAFTHSSKLAAVIGANQTLLTDVNNKIRDYIKANRLQDATNKNVINVDEKLKAVFGKNQVSVFEIADLVNQHLRHSGPDLSLSFYLDGFWIFHI